MKLYITVGLDCGETVIFLADESVHQDCTMVQHFYQTISLVFIGKCTDLEFKFL